MPMNLNGEQLDQLAQIVADTSDADRFANAYNYLFNLLGGDAGSVKGAEPAVWSWLKGIIIRVMKLGSLGVLTLGLSACNSSDPVGQTDWQDRSIFVQVGEVVYELAPGPAYAFDGIKDEQINKALSSGQGVRTSPLELRSFRIGVRKADSRSLDYDVSFANLGGERALREAVRMPDPATSLLSVDFNQSPNDVSGRTYEGSATFRFSNDQLVESPVRCRVFLIGEEIHNVFCSVSGLEHRGNRISLRARGGSAAEVASDFENGLKLISRIERN